MVHFYLHHAGSYSHYTLFHSLGMGGEDFLSICYITGCCCCSLALLVHNWNSIEMKAAAAAAAGCMLAWLWWTTKQTYKQVLWIDSWHQNILPSWLQSVVYVLDNSCLKRLRTYVRSRTIKCIHSPLQLYRTGKKMRDQSRSESNEKKLNTQNSCELIRSFKNTVQTPKGFYRP